MMCSTVLTNSSKFVNEIYINLPQCNTALICGHYITVIICVEVRHDELYKRNTDECC